MPEDWLPEQLKTLHNLCEVANILINIKRREFLPTILELILIEAQQIVDDNCVVKDGEAELH
jgi:hypothetical protein